uniref:Integrase core domain containing protein n=1 Tax=Solanum tuberosum TaxID=4113 RepID=M1DRJ3_SOLTU
MATLLQHMRPWMQHLIEDSEARMEKMMDQNIHAVHKRLYAFELRILKSLAPNIDVTTFQTELANLRADVDAILATPDTAPEVTPTTEEENAVMNALFGDVVPPSNSYRAVGMPPALTTLLMLRRHKNWRRISGSSFRRPRGHLYLMRRGDNSGPEKWMLAHPTM